MEDILTIMEEKKRIRENGSIYIESESDANRFNLKSLAVFALFIVIAEILNYSVNTVYNYKTRVIASSDLSPKEFHAALMRIR